MLDKVKVVRARLMQLLFVATAMNGAKYSRWICRRLIPRAIVIALQHRLRLGRARPQGAMNQRFLPPGSHESRR